MITKNIHSYDNKYDLGDRKSLILSGTLSWNTLPPLLVTKVETDFPCFNSKWPDEYSIQTMLKYL